MSPVSGGDSEEALLQKPERIHPEPTPELEDACEKLLNCDPVIGKPYAYGGWVYRLPNPDGGTSVTHDAEDDRANSLNSHAEAGSPHPEDVGRSLLEPRDQISQLNLLLDSAKSEINDRVEREKRLEEELMAEKAKLEKERARSAQLQEDGRRKVAELEEALAQVEEFTRAKEESFPIDAANWAAFHHTEVARSILTKPEDTMDFFKVMYMEPEGKRMITEIGSYDYRCGQRAERSILYTKHKKRDANFDPDAMKLPALYEEDPSPPFPLEYARA
ncbi:unnamed protein product [Cuscuta campestris]|uniref:Uncharacterized protein n=1 Tax=Cuscuta campestris TaxID=132261 RepID=A0A484MMI4_9ASTE|nr:unnamed protein product [Cuscuta campestris]